MKRDAVSWERAAEVCEAAQGWLRAGAIDEATHEAIREAYRDPCVTPSPVWRALTAVMTTAVILCALGAFHVAIRPSLKVLPVLFFLFATACLVATERLEASPRLARRGAAGATSFWGGVFVLLGLGLFLSATVGISDDSAIDAVLLASALVWGAGCWRWGPPLFAGFSAVSLFLFLGRFPSGRVLWVLAGAALAAVAARRLDDAAWAPSHRRAAAVLVVTGVGALYVAVNVYSLDEQLLEELQRFSSARIAPAPGRFAFIVSAVATAVLPLVVLLWAWASRRTFLLDTGIALLAVSLVTLRYYVHVAPLWVVLTVVGAVLVTLALAVERALRRAPGREMAGITADALFSDEQRQQVLQVVPVVATLTPPAHSPVAVEKGLAGSGGQFGGGGASGKF
jgi:hypothetical protein